MFLSQHFSYDEAVRSAKADAMGISNEPVIPLHRDNLYYTAGKMEEVRRVLGGRAIRVSSWYRSHKLNRAVGGSTTSAHAKGLAVDFTARGLTVLQTCVLLRDSDIRFDQLIYEYGAWIHIGFCNCPKPRRQVLTKLTGKPYVFGLPGA